jgi:hypothetical protein
LLLANVAMATFAEERNAVDPLIVVVVAAEAEATVPAASAATKRFLMFFIVGSCLTICGCFFLLLKLTLN